MRKSVLFALAATALFAAGAPRAEALPLSAPGGLNVAIQETNMTHEAAYVCRRVWRCGPYGCGWRRACWWQPGPYWGYRRPYYRHRYGWRHW